MLNIPGERIEFESVMRKYGFPDNHLRKDRKGKYLRKNTESAFQGWLLKALQQRKNAEESVND